MKNNFYTPRVKTWQIFKYFYLCYNRMRTLLRSI